MAHAKGVYVVTHLPDGSVVKQYRPVAFCCYINEGSGRPCRQPAAYEIVHGPAPEDYTHACLRHVGLMLTDAPYHTITTLALEQAESPKE